jgi:HEXXH motif-containing protein
LISLEDRIQAALSQGSERWYDGLAPELVASAWSRLRPIGITPDTYGVSRIIQANPTGGHRGSVMLGLAWGHPVRLEPFDQTMQQRYEPLGLRPLASESSTHNFESDLIEAMALLDRAGTAGAAVRALVWSITPLDVEGPDYDTGFSDPDLPFSIFIGAHEPQPKVSALRVAEGVLHEAMHLQLSLIEDIVPLVVGSAYERYSPWRGKPRPTQGLLHGLYVFRVVQDFLCGALKGGQLAPDELAHAQLRIDQINGECATLSALSESGDLTGVGLRLVERLSG